MFAAHFLNDVIVRGKIIHFMNFGKEIIKNCIERGWLFDGTTYWPPGSPEAERLRITASGKALKNKKRPQGIKTGDISDYRNIRNKAKQTDIFMLYVAQELNIELWPEFHFTNGAPNYRLDYAIPEYKIAIEQDGGRYLGWRGGHSSPEGIQRDMDKCSCLTAHGWNLIRRSKEQLMSATTLELIRQAVSNKL